VISISAVANRPTAAVEIRSPRNDWEWLEARQLIETLVDWMEEMFSVSPPVVQPGLVKELDEIDVYYSPPHGRFVIARMGGQTVGTTGIHLLSPDVAELKRVFVRPSARGHGLARLMLEAAIEAARDLGANRLVLESHGEVMAAAVRMYRARGFQEIPDYTDLAAKVDGVIAMELDLTAELAAN
jgi:GNAT superfamily N-acetyltransferase